MAATAKHYVANDSETDRLTVDVRVGERALREVYLAPFEAAVAAGVRLVMAGYNAVDGTTMTASDLLTDPLKGEWGFDGVVVSDWGAVRTTVDTARGGLDLAMPGPDSPWGEALARAVADGVVPEAAVDDKVRRLLRLAAWVGALGEGEAPGGGGPREARGGCGPRAGDTHPPAPRPAAAPEGRALARRAVAAGSVLLANRGVLPLDPGGLRTVAVIGAHAARTRTQGGGSAGVFPREEVSVLDGIRDALRGHARVVHVPGPRPDGPAPPLDHDACTDPRSGLPGVLLRMLDADGRELYAERRRGGACWSPGWCRARTPSRSAPGCAPVPLAAGRWAWPASAG